MAAGLQKGLAPDQCVCGDAAFHDPVPVQVSDHAGAESVAGRAVCISVYGVWHAGDGAFTGEHICVEEGMEHRCVNSASLVDGGIQCSDGMQWLPLRPDLYGGGTLHRISDSGKCDSLLYVFCAKYR